MLRECEVWAIRKTFWGRFKDRYWFGHTKHVCYKKRPFGQEHLGWHYCKCGNIWPKQETDND